MLMQQLRLFGVTRLPNRNKDMGSDRLHHGEFVPADAFSTFLRGAGGRNAAVIKMQIRVGQSVCQGVRSSNPPCLAAVKHRQDPRRLKRIFGEGEGGPCASSPHGALGGPRLPQNLSHTTKLRASAQLSERKTPKNNFFPSRVRIRLTEALALVGGPVHEDLGGDDGAEGQKHLHELIVPKLLWQVVDEQVTTLRT